MLVFVLDEIDGFNNVLVVQRRGNAKFGRELLDILLFGFILASLAEFLQTQIRYKPMLDRGNTRSAYFDSV